MAIRIPVISEFSRKGIDQATASVRDLEKKSKRSFDGIKRTAQVASVAVAAVGAAAVVAAIDFTKAALEEETSSKKLANTLKRVTGASKKTTDGVEDFISKLQLATATSDSELRPAMERLVRSTEDVGEAQELLALSVDISSATGKDLESVAGALGKAADGSFTSLKKLGLGVDDAAIKAGDFEGIIDKLGNRFGGFAEDQAGTTEGQLKTLGIQFDELKEQAGAVLIPALDKTVRFLNQKLIPAVGKVVDIFKKDGLGGVFKLVADQVKKQAPKVWEAFKDLAGRAWRAFAEWLKVSFPPAIRRLGELVGDLANWLLDEGLPKLVDKLKEWGNAFVEWIKPLIGPALKELGKFIAKLSEWALTVALPKLLKIGGEWLLALGKWSVQLAPEIIKGIAAAFVEIVKKIPGIAVDLLAKMGNLGIDIAKAIGGGIIDGITAALTGAEGLAKSVVNGIIDFINTELIDGLNDLLKFEIPLPFGKKFTVDPPDLDHIPRLANGGIVSRPTLALIGEAGPEAVVPLNQGNGVGGINITVNGALDPIAVGRQIRQILAQDSARFAGLGG